MASIRALVSRRKSAVAALETLIVEKDLPAFCGIKQFVGSCNTTVQILYSSINYKDALVVRGVYPGLAYPMVPGIDLVGKVIQSDVFLPHTKVFINGFGLGTDHFGGFAEVARVKTEWCQEFPEGLCAYNTARLGTAGYTAMLCVDALVRENVLPKNGPILVTGASGGVGSISVALLSELGYEVVALSGKSQQRNEWFSWLGASATMSRQEFETEARPLGKALYAASIDTCGGLVLANVLNQVKEQGVVAACGLTSGMKLHTTMAPFILRGIQLKGIESVFLNMERRKEVYQKYAPTLVKSHKLDLVSNVDDHVLSLEQVPKVAEKLLKGNLTGRYIVDMSI